MALAGSYGTTLWPQEDTLRLLSLLQASSVGSILAACTALHHQLQAPAGTMRKHRADPVKCSEAVQAQQTLASLEASLSQACQFTGTQPGASPAAWQGARQTLQSMETSMYTECRYCYGPDWDVKPGKLVSRKGTWLKVSTRFSWELTDTQKLYVPQGVVMPVMQIGRVTDPTELQRHDWASQHVRVWMKPTIVRTLEARRGVWFVYYPHFEDKGRVLIALADTWLKRTTVMSGELEPFELIYVPKGLPVHLATEPALVEEEWEKSRHQHVHLHRKLILASPPLTMKQDKYDIFVGQGEDRWA